MQFQETILTLLIVSTNKTQCSFPSINSAGEEENDDFNLHIGRYRPEELQKLTTTTKFTKKEIQLMYRGFKQVIT